VVALHWATGTFTPLDVRHLAPRLLQRPAHGHGWRNEHEADGDHRRRQGWGTAAATLRDEGFGGPVMIISEADS
jgi:hypothetical protein